MSRGDDGDSSFKAFGVVWGFPKAAGDLEDVIWHDHGEGVTAQVVSLVHTVAADLERSVEKVDGKVEAFSLDAAIEGLSALTLNEAELENGVDIRGHERARYAPDDVDAAVLSLGVPRHETSVWAIGAKERGKPSVKGDVDSALLQGELRGVGGFAGTHGPFDQSDYGHERAEEISV